MPRPDYNFRSYFDDFRKDTGFPDIAERPELYIQYIIARDLDKILKRCENLDSIDSSNSAIEDRLNEVLKTVNDIKGRMK